MFHLRHSVAVGLHPQILADRLAPRVVAYIRPYILQLVSKINRAEKVSEQGILRLHYQVRQYLRFFQNVIVAVNATLVSAATYARCRRAVCFLLGTLDDLHLHVLGSLYYRVPYRIAAVGNVFLAGCAVHYRLDVSVVDGGDLTDGVGVFVLGLYRRRLHSDSRHVTLGHVTRTRLRRARRRFVVGRSVAGWEQRCRFNFVRCNVTLVEYSRIADFAVELVTLYRCQLLLFLIARLVQIVDVVPLNEFSLLLEAVARPRTRRGRALEARVFLRVRGLGAAALLRRYLEPSFLLAAVVVVEALLLNFVVVVNIVTIRLDVLSQGRRIGVTLRAAGHLAAVRLVDGVRSRVFETIRRVRVCLVATLDRTDVRPLAGVRSRVYLQILRSAETLVALETVVRLLVRVRPHVNQHFVPAITDESFLQLYFNPTPEVQTELHFSRDLIGCEKEFLPRIKSTLATRTSFPSAVEEPAGTRAGVEPRNVTRQLFQGRKPSSTVQPSVTIGESLIRSVTMT